MKKKSSKLTARDRQILQHIVTHRMSMFDAIHKLFFHGKEVDAVKSTLRRLGKKQKGLIESTRIEGTSKVYYRLTRKGADSLGLKDYECQGLRNSQLPQAYSMLWFTSFPSGNVTRKLCRPSEFPQLFKFLGSRLPKIDFYVAETIVPNSKNNDVAFGVALTDFNSPTRRIIDRAKKHIGKILEKGWFAELIIAGKFELTVLTGTSGKKHSIDLKLRSELHRTQRHRLIRIMPDSFDALPFMTQVIVVPNLFELVPGKTSKGDL